MPVIQRHRKHHIKRKGKKGIGIDVGNEWYNYPVSGIIWPKFIFNRTEETSKKCKRQRMRIFLQIARVACISAIIILVLYRSERSKLSGYPWRIVLDGEREREGEKDKEREKILASSNGNLSDRGRCWSRGASPRRANKKSRGKSLSLRGRGGGCCYVSRDFIIRTPLKHSIH